MRYREPGKREKILIKIHRPCTQFQFTNLEPMPQSSLPHIEDANVALLSSRYQELVLWSVGQTRCALIVTSERCENENFIRTFPIRFLVTTYMQPLLSSAAVACPKLRRFYSRNCDQLNKRRVINQDKLSEDIKSMITNLLRPDCTIRGT